MNKIKEMLLAIGSAGKNADGSYTRTCYSREYFQAATSTKKEMQKLKMMVDEDAAGNVHGMLQGTDKKNSSIVVGSHLDTVPQGGLFDGAYGVAAALEVLRRLEKNKVTLRHTFEIYGFNAEESNPLGGTFGSRAITGWVDVNQSGFKEALAQYKHTPEEILACKRDLSKIKCYLEIHIEQGDHLFNDNINIGVVSGIVGIVRYKVTAIGASNHAGTTMMKKRKDAMVGMAKLIVAADEMCRKIDDNLVLTVGTIKCWPDSANVIPGKVECSFEMRHMDAAKTDELIKQIKNYTLEIDNAKFTIEKTVDKGSVPCDKHVMSSIEKAANESKVSYVVMPSGAGHDANPMGHKIPVGMIFVPSKNGLSHCGEEWTEETDLENGVKVLYNAVLALDKE
jgi:N-carbamoyl-L-amino-acid hydrolase